MCFIWLFFICQEKFEDTKRVAEKRPTRNYKILHRKLSGEFEDTKGAIRIRKSKKDRQHNDQKKKDKSTNNDLQSILIKLKIE
jgi:hypothetical protein